MTALYLLLAKLDAGDVGVPTGTSDEVLANILNITYGLAGLVAVIIIISSGLMMTVQGNSPDKIAKRKNMITYAVIGLIVILIAFTITQFVLGRF